MSTSSVRSDDEAASLDDEDELEIEEADDDEEVSSEDDASDKDESIEDDAIDEDDCSSELAACSSELDDCSSEDEACSDEAMESATEDEDVSGCVAGSAASCVVCTCGSSSMLCAKTDKLLAIIAKARAVAIMRLNFILLFLLNNSLKANIVSLYT